MSKNDKSMSKLNTARRKGVIEWVVLVLIVVILVAMVVLSIDASKDSSNRTDESGSKAQELLNVDREGEEGLPDIYSDYPQLGQDTVVARSSGDDVISTLKEGTGVVFLGFPECPWCQGLMPVVDQAARNVGLGEIKYLDIKSSREKGDSTYEELLSILDDRLPVGDDGGKVIYVPDMTVVIDGEIVFRYEAEDSPENESSPDTYWTAERTERIRQLLESEFKAIVDM